MTAVGLLLLICQPAWAWQATTRELEESEERAFKQAVSQVAPSLVRIETVGGLDQVQNFLLGNGPTTGVVVSADGYVISSSFNFLSKPSSILVTTTDGKRLAAKAIANDTVRMLTLLKVEAEGLVPAKPESGNGRLPSGVRSTRTRRMLRLGSSAR
ncbi:MAG: PDZ/DHR/GLGF domain-containing protein [Planctomycetota bacterium]|nr:MAG: PDZ/DHR/GLGF domain-containing protein [Planctomycetota bacterium]